MSYPGPPPRPRGSGGALAVAISAMSVILVVTIVSFAVAHTGSTQHSASVGVGSVPSGSIPSGSVPSGADFPGATATGGTDGSGAGTSSQSTPVPPTPTYTPPSTHPYTPPPSLDPVQVQSAIKSFFDGFVYHNTGQVRQVVCPKYLSYYQGTYINGNEISRWQSRATSLPAGQRQVAIYVAADLRDPNTGASAGEYNHSWIVEMESNRHYYVCGYVA